MKLNPNGGGFVALEEYKQSPKQELARVKVPFKMGTKYKVQVLDEGRQIRVLIDGKEVLKQKMDDEGSGYVGFYNREPVAGIRHVSLLTGLGVQEKETKKDKK